MKNLLSPAKKALLGWYAVSVVAASLFLMLQGWGSAEGFRGYMDLISLCIWQAVVWPLHLLLWLAGKA